MVDKSYEAFLECPNCNTPAVKSSGFDCVACEDGCHEERKTTGECTEEPEPLWYDGDEDTCPECGMRCRVSTDGDSPAYLTCYDPETGDQIA